MDEPGSRLEINLARRLCRDRKRRAQSEGAFANPAARKTATPWLGREPRKAALAIGPGM